MGKSFRFRRLAASVSLLMVFGLTLGQSQNAEPVRTVLAGGHVRYVAPATRQFAAAAGAVRKAQLTSASQSALTRYAPYFGIDDPLSQLRTLRSVSLGGRGDVVRYQQLYQGLPVIGGELVLSLDAAGEVNSLSGEVAQDLKLQAIQPTVTAAQAAQSALLATTKYYPESRASLEASEPVLSVYDPGLIGPDKGAPLLVWRLEVRSRERANVRELVLVDARNGGIALHFNQVEQSLVQATYTANGGSTLPGSKLCDETQPQCTGGSNADADLAHRYALDTYNFYKDHHGRDSFDNLGATLISSVSYFKSSDCPNAFWNGTQMVYCAGAASADDVVAHELTHAVTERTSDLLYYYQAGAINESLSDAWGEFIDLTNGAGNDSPSSRWLVGEDWSGIGPARSMANPPAFGDPDRMSSPLYWTGTTDNGGVHTNSGVNNKAVSLMVDGGSFNGFTVSGIGINKVAALYYRVQTQHLTSGSDYADLYLALNQACRNMIGGADGIAAGDCQQVANALDAVEMNLPAAFDAGTEAAICPVNQAPVDVFYNSAENSTQVAQFAITRLVGTAGNWFFGPFATTGKSGYFTPGVNTSSDYTLTMVNPVVVPANASLHFRHLFDQEATATTSYDGGLVEYSTDGVSWTDLSALYGAGQGYNGTVAPGFGNPAGGRNAFVARSHGFVSTRYSLASLAGQSVRIRFRNTSDTSAFTGMAWAIDDVRIYTCVTDASANVAPLAQAGVDQTLSPARQVTLDASASHDPDGFIVSALWSQISGPAVVPSLSGRVLSFTSPRTPVQDSLVFRLTVTDNRGAVSTDDVTVTVINQQPVADGGADLSGKPRNIMTLRGTATDSDGTVAGYDWVQVAGPPVALGRIMNSWSVGANGQSITLRTGPLVAGTSVLNLDLAPNVLTNAGGEVLLNPYNSTFHTCSAQSQTTCVAGTSALVAGTLTAPSTNPGQARKWTLQGVQAAGGSQITGSFVFDAATQTVSNIDVVVSVASLAAVDFVAPSVPAVATLKFRLTATDDSGGTGTDDVDYTVTNQQPSVSAGIDASANAGASVNLSAVASDPDGSIASYNWVQTAGPAVALSGAGTAAAQFTAPSASEASTLAFQLTVTDNDGASASDTMTVNVQAKKSGGGSLDLYALAALALLATLQMRRRRHPAIGR